MRLDHLLSKEHCSRESGTEPAPAGCVGGVLNGGDTGELEPATAPDVEYSPVGVSLRGGKDGGVRLGLVLNTLLGPEETSTPRLCWGCLCLRVPDPDRVETSPLWVGSAGRFGGWSLFENCTVDASIFVVKLPRANGGCLGTRSR